MIDVITKESPRWMIELEKQVKATSQSKVAKALGYSPAVISQVLKGSYKGSIDRVAETVCSVFLGETVICPVMGELEKHRCRQFQKESFSATNPVRVRRYRACRSNCVNSEIKE